MRALKLVSVPVFLVLANLVPARGQQFSTTSDPYRTWAITQWGTTVVNDPTKEATVWGQSADPDGDGNINLHEYAFGTDPRQSNINPISWDYGKTTPGHITVSYTQRVDDNALVVIPQYSVDMSTWWPVPPRDAFSWLGDGTYFWNTASGPAVNGLQNVTKVGTSRLTGDAATFSRVLVMRNGTATIGSPLDAINFFDSVSGISGTSVDSNSVVLSGFSGRTNLTVSGGAHLIVNGVDVGASASVAAGSTVRLRTLSPADGSSASFALTIGGTVTRNWNVASRAPVAPSLALPVRSGSSSSVVQSAVTRRSAGKVSAASATLAPGVSSIPSGYTPVNASVGESGEASISIPITVPPGTGGMEPKLAIAYSSQGGNGPLGVGFGVSGISAVARTGPAPYLDGIKGGITFGPNDRFTIDGQRLILYSGTWGADGSEYRTENESFAKITFHILGTNGASYWEMKTKAGLTYSYGNSVDSRIMASRFAGDAATLSWALTTVTDNLGSRYRCIYAAPTAADGGYARITSILYTENQAQSLSAGEEVSFTYAARPDARVSYVAGVKVTMGQVLTAIECRQGGNVARRYEFAYQQAEISNNSQLFSVTEKGKKPSGTGDAWQTFPATTFTWDQKPAGTAKMSATTPATDPTLGQLGFSKSPPSLIIQGDFNGDGRMDVMQFDEYGGSDIWVAFGKSDGTLQKVTAAGFTSADADDYTKNTVYSRIITGDFNGDGKTDALQMSRSGGNNWVALSNGDGSFNVLHGNQIGALQSVGQTGDYQTDVFALDLNGDGRTDIVLLNKSGNNRVFLSSGDGSFSEVPIPANDPFKSFRIAPDSDGTNTYLVPGDFNGDGLGDILLLYADGNHQLALSRGDGTFTVRTGAQLGSIAGVGFRRTRAAFVSGDFNGDGLTDLAHFDNDTYPAWLALCKGDGTFDAILNPPSLQGLPLNVPTASLLLAGDFSGNGFSDIFHASYPYSGSGWLAYSEGDTSFVVQNAGKLGVLDGQTYDKFNDARMRDRLFVGDFDGDGTDDILYLYQEADVSYHTRSTGFNADRVAQVTNGHGGYTRFNYKPLTDPTVYTKGTMAVYPDYDVAGAMYVVASTVMRNAVDGDAFVVQTDSTVSESATTYSYERARSKLDGHGYQGFAAVQSTNQDTLITSRTEYVTGDPHLSGHPAHQIQILSNSGVVINETTNTWASNPITLPSGMMTYFPYTTASVTKDYEINNGIGAAAVKTTTISGQIYDAFGNLTYSLTDYGGGFTEEMTSTYTNDTNNWWLGRLNDTVVKQVSPKQPFATRHSTFQYSSINGQLTRETIVTPESNLSLQKDYVHDAFGNILKSKVTDLGTKVKRKTKTTYTADGRFISKTSNALNQTETRTYDPLDGTVLSQTGPNGLKTLWTYDGFGRQLTETRPDGTQTLTQYSLCAPGSGVPPRAVHCVYNQSSGSGLSAVYFDLLDRQIRQDATSFDGNMVSTHMVFNKKGETVNTSLPFFSSSTRPTAPAGQYTTNSYDDISRITEQDVPGGTNGNDQRVTKTAYTGLSATVTNPNGQTFQSVTDLRGRTTSSTSFGTDTVTNTHDPYGNLVQVDDGRGHITQMSYDGRGNKTTMTEPNSGTTIYGYNAFGELTSQTDALGRVTTLSYDALGRMVKRIEPDAPGVSNGVQAAGQSVETDWVYEYAPDGQPNPNGVGKLGYVWRKSDGYLESYYYDAFGRPTETHTQVGSMQFVSSTTFDEYGRPDTLSYPTGFAVHNHYNANGHLDYVYDASMPTLRYWTATSVNARGQVVQEQFGNGLTSQRGYDPFTGLLSSIQTGSSGMNFTASVQNLAYTFDKLNNLTHRQNLYLGVTEDFTYDATNQLAGTTCSAADAVTIACDHLGNIQSRSDVGIYTYGERKAGPHAVTSIIGVDGKVARKLKYDAVGNCTKDGKTKLAYNAANQPTSILAAAGSITFSYTPSRVRLKRTELTAGALTDRVYIGGLYERDDGPNGIVHTHFIPAGGGVVAIHTRTQTTGGTASQTRYVHKDHLGSVQSLTDENGGLVETLDYDAWGRRRVFDGATRRFSYGQVASQTDRGFTGHEMLDAVDLIHMNGRIYDPTIGRFLSVDLLVQEPSNLQNYNRYTYVLNNPLSLTDPSGFFSIGKFFKKYWKPAVAIAAGIVTGGSALAAIYGLDGILVGSTAFLTGSLASGASISVGAAITAGAAAGFGSAFTGTLLSGGSIGDAFRAGTTGAAWGGISAGAFQEIDVVLPDWLKTRPLPNQTMITPERLLGQAERIGIRGATSAGIAHLQGGKFRAAFFRSLEFDGLSFAQDVADESQWRSEIRAGYHSDNPDDIGKFNQGFEPAQKPAVWKPETGEAVDNPIANNTGTPLGGLFPSRHVTDSKIGLLTEGGSLSNFLAFDVPGIHQISLYHDVATTIADDVFGANSFASKAFSIGSALPYAGFVYGKYINEEQMRSGQLSH